VDGLGIYEHAHMLHRAWRYRLNTERDELRYLRSLNLRASTCVDIGANTGIYTYWMLKQAGRSGRVVAFEPQPEMVEHLERFKRSFRAGNLEIVAKGLSSEPGAATLRRDMGHLGGASVARGDDYGDSGVEIGLTTLDAFFGQSTRGRVGFIKCDVEGHEHEVVRGGAALLARDEPTLLVECHDALVRGTTLFDDLSSIGYRAFFFHARRKTPMDRWDELRPTIAAPYLNYIFEPG